MHSHVMEWCGKSSDDVIIDRLTKAKDLTRDYNKLTTYNDKQPTSNLTYHSFFRIFFILLESVFYG